MAKKRSRTRTPRKTPKRTSERKRRRTAKGVYYDEHFDQCIATNSPPAPDSNINEAVEKCEDSAMQSPPGPDVVGDADKQVGSVCAINVDTPISGTKPESILSDVEDSESPTPITISTQQIFVPTIPDDSPSAITDCTISADTSFPSPTTVGTQEMTGDIGHVTSTPSSLEANKTCPLINRHAQTEENCTPIRAAELNNTVSLKQELEMATSINKFQKDENSVERSFVVTPSTPRITRERSRSEPARLLDLRLEVEEPISPQTSPLVTNKPHILPKSVMVVDSRFVGEIHFELDKIDNTTDVADTDDIDEIVPAHDENLAFLSAIYELYFAEGKAEGNVEVGVEDGVGVEVGEEVCAEVLKSEKVVQAVVSELSWQEKYRIQSLSTENEVLKKQLFQKNQQLNLANDRSASCKTITSTGMKW